jgi:hypothetical protein
MHLALVVDNFEHLLATAPFIGMPLAACPALAVLAAAETRHRIAACP